MSVSVYNLLHEAIPNPGVAMGMEAVTTASLLTALHGIDSATKLVKIQVQDGDCVYTVDGSTPASDNGYILYQGSEAWFNRATYEAGKIISLTGTPVLAISEFVYSVDATLRAAGLAASLQTVTFSSLYDYIVRSKTEAATANWEAAANNADKDYVATLIEQAVSAIWEHAWWPMLMLSQVATPEEVGALKVLAYDDAALANFGALQGIFKVDPLRYGASSPIRGYEIRSGGIYFLESVSTVYPVYRPRPPQFTRSQAYNAGTTYSAGDVVYWSDTGECYMALQGTTGNSPASLSYWERQPIPYYFAAYVRARALADWFGQDGQKLQKVSRWEARAEQELYRVYDRHLPSQGIVQTANVTIY